MRKIKKGGKAGSEGNYVRCWKYIKESKIYFLIILTLFLFSLLIGYFLPVFFQELIKNLIEDLVKKTAGMDFYQLLLFILKNNITTAFFGLLLGIILGFFPIMLAIMNGYVLGFIFGKTAKVYGFSVLFRLLPHGIFELPALVLSLGLGLKLASFIFAKNKKEQLKYDLENSLRVFIYVILPLLIVAGVIETALIFVLG